MKKRNVLLIGSKNEVLEKEIDLIGAVLFTCKDINKIEDIVDQKHIKIIFIDESLINAKMIEKLRIRFSRGRVAIVANMQTNSLEKALELFKLGTDDCLHVKDSLLKIRLLRILSDLDFIALSIEKSQMDYLTNLYNRMSFQDLAQQVCSISKYENTNLCCAMIDIDYFKNVNDTHGHIVGDEVIKSVASVVKTHFRKNDLVGRFGGEEFIVLMHDISQNKAYELFESLRKKIEDLHVYIDDLDLNITVSIGLYSGYCYDLGTLQSRADEFLYKAKNRGRNRLECQ